MTIHNDIQRFKELGPSHYRFLKSLSLLTNSGRSNYSHFDIDITLSRSGSGGIDDDIKIQFINTTEIKIGDLSIAGGVYLNICDVRERGLEIVKYTVSDLEEATFSFGCSDFTILVGAESLR